MARSILLIGASGHLGRRLAQRLAVRDLVAPSHRELDLTDVDGLRACLRSRTFDAIVVPGGFTKIEGSEADPGRAFAANAVGPGVIAEESRGAHVIFFSTDCVFDGREGPYATDAPANPINVYGRSKVEGERRILAAGIWSIVRTSHIYSFDRTNNFFMFVARRVLSGEPVTGYTDQCTTPTDADDLADATLRVIDERIEGVLHLAGSQPVTRYDYACEVARVFGKEGVITPGNMPNKLRPSRAGLISDLIPYREGIARQADLFRKYGGRPDA